MGRTLGICGPILARVAPRTPLKAMKRIKKCPHKQTLWETPTAFHLLRAPVTLESGWLGHEGIIGKDAGDLWPYSREDGSSYTNESDEDNKTGARHVDSLGNINRVSSSEVRTLAWDGAPTRNDLGSSNVLLFSCCACACSCLYTINVDRDNKTRSLLSPHSRLPSPYTRASVALSRRCSSRCRAGRSASRARTR